MCNKKTLLQHLIFFIHRVLVKVFPYFPCCASCGEIKKPIKQRFCTSLSFTSPISALLYMSELEKIEQEILLLNKYFPWLYNIIIFTDKKEIFQHSQIEKYSSKIHLSFFFIERNNSNIFSYVPTITNLCEHFILCNDLTSFHNVLDPLDFFTPNGIPLFRLQKNSNTGNLFKGYRLNEECLAFTKEVVKATEKNKESISQYTFENILYESFVLGYSLPISHFTNELTRF